MDRDRQRIYRLKTILLALVAAVSGVGLLFFAKQTEYSEGLAWLRGWPIFELGSTLFITGALVVAWDYLDGRDREAREDARLRRLLLESAPQFRDAVVQGFAVSPQDLERVATPELLDGIVTNALGLRLGDPQFAAELYADVRDQAIRAPERWDDVEISVRLSTAVERDTAGIPLFDVLVTWEYTTIPSHPVRRFACVSDRDDFYDLVTDVPATMTWFLTPRLGVDAASQASFELLEFAVDGQPRPIRRSSRKAAQTYSVTVGQELVNAKQPVRIRHTYRTIAAKDSHRLFVEIAQPARNVSLELDYTSTDIARLQVSDLVSSAHKPRIAALPDETPGKALSIEVPGWLLPRSGFTFVWTLNDEATPTSATRTPPAGHTSRARRRGASAPSTNHRS